MTRLNQRAYRTVVIVDGHQSASHVVIAYNQQCDQTITFMNFYRIAWTTDDSHLQIQSSRQANFQEQLRILNEAGHFYRGNQSHDQNEIKQKMHEAYGNDSEVNITPISEANT